jgi:hypothetical protein
MLYRVIPQSERVKPKTIEMGSAATQPQLAAAEA